MRQRTAILLAALGTFLATTAWAGDTYDKEATDIVIKRAVRQVNANCGSAKDENGKAVGPWGKGSVTVVLGRNGHSKNATIGAPFDGKPPGKCAVQAFSNLTFPPWNGPDTPLTVDVELTKPAVGAW